MSRPSIVPQIKAQLEVWLEQRMAEWSTQPEQRRQPNLPATSEGKVNVRELTLALGLQRSQEQHFFNHAELRTLVKVAAEAQGLTAIGSRIQQDAADDAVRSRPGRFEPSACEVARRAYPAGSRRHVGALCGAVPRSDDADRPRAREM
ncbi:hypothetical protein [Pseudoduganella danionis]|uniref:hypothetical protein n=1 Tax=Pseudoduganella danionis TaxID=1890295 RepID=UPI0035B208A5